MTRTVEIDAYGNFIREVPAVVAEPAFWAQGSTYAWLALAIFSFWGFCLWFFPVYSVWSSRKRGEAQLAEANFAEQVAISEANARLKAAEINKKAEVIDAEAVAESVGKIGGALASNDGYLRWQWIKAMADNEPASVVYVPTEANLPILEAGRMRAPQ
jgi:hypothetical protein